MSVINIPSGTSPIIQALVDHWLDLHPAPSILPGRQHIDPEALSRLHKNVLPHIWLLDVEANPRRYRLRLIGSALTGAGSPGRPGRFLDEVDTTGVVTERVNPVVDSRRPAFRRGAPVLPHSKAVAELENVYLPLATDGVQVDMILACTLYTFRQGATPVNLLLG